MTNDQLLIELALFLNQELLTDNKINYQVFKATEDFLLQHLKNN